MATLADIQDQFVAPQEPVKDGLTKPKRSALAPRYDRAVGGERNVQRSEDAGMSSALSRLEIEEAIPHELCLAVAEVLAWVYRLENDKG